MKKTIKLTESDLTRIVKRIINETIYVGNQGMTSDESGYEDLRDEIESGDAIDFKKYGTVYVLSVMGDGYLVSDDIDQRYMGDYGDGYLIPLSAAKHAILLDKGDEGELI